MVAAGGMFILVVVLVLSFAPAVRTWTNSNIIYFAIEHAGPTALALAVGVIGLAVFLDRSRPPADGP